MSLASQIGLLATRIGTEIKAVRAEIAAFKWKPTLIKCSTVANVTLSGTQTIDDISAGVGDLVLVQFQTATADNGVYTVQSGAWTRSPGFDTVAKLSGAVVMVSQGTYNGGTVYMQSPPLTGTLGTNTCPWVFLGPAARTYHGPLAQLAQMSYPANEAIYFPAANTISTYALTAQARALLDDTTVAQQQATLQMTHVNTGVVVGGGANTDTFTPTYYKSRNNAASGVYIYAGTNALVSGAGTTVTYGEGAFPNNTLCVVMTRSTGTATSYSIVSWNAAGFTATVQANGNFAWIALGY